MTEKEELEKMIEEAYSILKAESEKDPFAHRKIFGDTLEDLQRIYYSIHKEHYKPNSLSVSPEIIKSNGCTGIEVIVNLENGIDEAGRKRIIEECRKYKKDIWLKPLEELGAFMDIGWDCKRNIMASEGKLFMIVVEGEDEKAERMALRIYSALTSENSYSMNFDRFEKARKTPDYSSLRIWLRELLRKKARKI